MSGRYGCSVANPDDNASAARASAAGPGLFPSFFFLVELAALAALAWAGASASAGLAVRIVLAIAAPVIMAVIWGLFMAPTSKRRLRDPARLVAQIVAFLVAAVALAVAGHVVPAIVFGIVAIASAAVLRVVAPEE